MVSVSMVVNHPQSPSSSMDGAKDRIEAAEEHAVVANDDAAVCTTAKRLTGL